MSRRWRSFRAVAARSRLRDAIRIEDLDKTKRGTDHPRWRPAPLRPRARRRSAPAGAVAPELLPINAGPVPINAGPVCERGAEPHVKRMPSAAPPLATSSDAGILPAPCGLTDRTRMRPPGAATANPSAVTSMTAPGVPDGPAILTAS